MKHLLALSLLLTFTLVASAQLPPKEPSRVSTTANLRDFLLTSKWSWRNVSAGVPDRECVFMPDGTFRHPHFTAKFVIKDIKTVELNRKGGEQAVMTFSDDYSTFEVLDFDKARRITGKRLPK
ncbi:hypothetical protein [Verrucomicrobium spinosum]|uniref:hypothetical protein n=1 Tax=Verrucomicrobium spinosum TaxID=2736 RepID=UPI000174662F|nr:hypothetical protein [Verrucomicrobium spinosum]